jgi:hypothetical protein
LVGVPGYGHGGGVYCANEREFENNNTAMSDVFMSRLRIFIGDLAFQKSEAQCSAKGAEYGSQRQALSGAKCVAPG